MSLRSSRLWGRYAIDRNIYVAHIHQEIEGCDSIAAVWGRGEEQLAFLNR